MYRSQRTSLAEDRLLNHVKTPSFSSSLLDQIYRSIDDGERESGEIKLYPETTARKQTRIGGKHSNRCVQEVELATESLPRACILDKWMDEKMAEKHGTHGRPKPTEMDKKVRRRHDRQSQDALFFSSTSSSSDSSYGGFSSSDTESMFGVGSGASRFAPPRPKPVRTSVSDEKERRHSAQIYGHKEVHTFDAYRQNPSTTANNEGLIKSKSRALKIYNNLKKVKQPISPGGRLTNFLNSLFTHGNTKKSKSTPALGGYEDLKAERKSKSGQASVSACSSASSFSRSCLSKTSPSSRHKLRDGVQRSVRFCPVSVIVDEESRPCGHKYLYEQNDHSVMMPVSVPTAWKIGRSPLTYKKNDGEIKLAAMEKSRRVEEAGRELLKEYLQNQKKSDFTLMDLPLRTNEYEDEDDDAASYSSSDLFELDHLAVMEKGRYCEELPVYETTHFSTNRAIANGLIT
ncbi:protein BIG GRAIN 1-like B [Neltuma alba]|uniref:protein BIG GRAIN 1-like B n=1 Tax=Neltuma alba TaxID=207710 RepID=UPI0010A54361|nr:protein BIG GRAIN 1-like B [Prosopis alba]